MLSLILYLPHFWCLLVRWAHVFYLSFLYTISVFANKIDTTEENAAHVVDTQIATEAAQCWCYCSWYIILYVYAMTCNCDCICVVIIWAQFHSAKRLHLFCLVFFISISMLCMRLCDLMRMYVPNTDFYERVFVSLVIHTFKRPPWHQRKKERKTNEK